jgi:hypothetical protein
MRVNCVPPQVQKPALDDEETALARTQLVLPGGVNYCVPNPCSTPFAGQGRRYASPAVYASAGDP